MYDHNSNKSIESNSEDNIFTSQNTHNKSQKYSNLKEETKDLNNISNPNSGEEELIRKKLIISTDNDIPSKQKIPTSLITPKSNQGTLAFSLSPIKKGGRKKNMLVDIMEKSKKMNVPKKSVIYPIQELRINSNNENQRKDGYGVPINKRNKKKIKVTFTDTLNTVNSKNEKNQLAEIIPIESYKKYNYVEGIPREEDIATTKSTCQCCIIN